MATYRQKTQWWAAYQCNTADLVSLNLNGRFPVRVQAPLTNATLALEKAMLGAGYPTPMGATGSYLCRQIAGTSLYSLHAFGVALDWDYPSNPHLRTTIEPGFGTDPRFKITEAQVNAVEQIVNAEGDSIWKWLGWSIGDTMHFEADVPPDRCEPVEEDGMPQEQWHQLIDALFAGRPDMFKGNPSYWKTLDSSSSEWADFWNAFVRAISLT
jgi:hypothetical protein